MKKILIAVVILAIVGGLWWFVRRGAKPSDNPAPRKTAIVTRGDIEIYVEATGSVESNLDVDIKCKASGEIISLPYDVSDRVPRLVEGGNEAEALLVALDPIDESRRVERAQAARDAAQAAVNQATHGLAIAKEELRVARLEATAGIAAAAAQADLDQLQLERQKQMLQRGASTQNELDIAAAAARISQAKLQTARAAEEALKRLELGVARRQADIDLAGANLGAAEVDLADAQQRLTETKVYSPIDGVVTRRDVQIGQIIASGIVNIGGGTTLLTVSDLSRVFVVAAVDESDIGRLVETGALGQATTITADAYAGRGFEGKVVRITPRGVTEANVVTFAVKIEVLGEDKALLLPKMTANVRILARRKPKVLLVPIAAVRYERDSPFVEVRRDGEFRRQAVTLGLHGTDQVEVLEGLRPGEEVALAGGVVTRWSNAVPTATAPARDERQGRK